MTEEESLVDQKRVEPLNEYAAKLRSSKGAGGEGVPYFTSKEGGAEAKILYLLQDPGRSGASRSGYMDPDNKGPTAKNFREAKAGMDPRAVITWNAVPWPVKQGKLATELRVAREEQRLDELLELLPCLRVVVLLGDEAHKLTEDLYVRRPQLHILHGPHPSWRGVKTPGKKKWLRNTVCKAYELIEDGSEDTAERESEG